MIPEPVHNQRYSFRTPAVTTRGMKERDMEVIAEIIQTIIDNPEKLDEVSQMVKNLCKNFKLYE